MEHKPALYALIKLHAELAFSIKANKDERERLREDMLHVEAVLKLLELGFSVCEIARKRRYNPNPLFAQGHDLLGCAGGAEGSAGADDGRRDRGSAAASPKGVIEPAKVERERMYGAVEASLRNHRGKTVIADDGHPRCWRAT